ncbi:MAG: hypothetical protein JXJ04_08280, partial [Spirochaetales bacterium]|nr:hypothetical protein [Spirochaetales bacterium]
NQAEKLPLQYSDKDLKIHTDKNEIIGHEDLVRVSGTRYYHKKEDKSTYYIIIDKVEKMQ